MVSDRLTDDCHHHHRQQQHHQRLCVSCSLPLPVINGLAAVPLSLSLCVGTLSRWPVCLSFCLAVYSLSLFSASTALQLFNAIRQTHYRCRWGEPPPAGLNVLLSSVAAAAVGIQLQSSVMFNLGISLGIFQWQWRRQEETQTDTGSTKSIGLDWTELRKHREHQGQKCAACGISQCSAAGRPWWCLTIYSMEIAGTAQCLIAACLPLPA